MSRLCGSATEERLQPGTAQSLSVGPSAFVPPLYEKQPDFQAAFHPGACHLPNEWPSFLDSRATHSPSCHETSEPTVLLFTAEDCFQLAHLHTSGGTAWARHNNNNNNAWNSLWTHWMAVTDEETQLLLVLTGHDGEVSHMSSCPQYNPFISLLSYYLVICAGQEWLRLPH